MIITGTIELPLLGANERAYEGVLANITLDYKEENDELTLVSVDFDELFGPYVESLGSSEDYWEDKIIDGWANDNHTKMTIVESVLDNMDDDQHDRFGELLADYLDDHDERRKRKPVAINMSSASDIFGNMLGEEK